MKDKFIYIYYAILIVIITLWNSDEQAPAMVLRLAFLCAALLPVMIKRVDFLPAALICLLTITQYGYSYSFMPTMLYIYVAILLVFIVVQRPVYNHINLPKCLIILCVLFTVVDLITGMQILELSYSLLIAIIFLLLTPNDSEEPLHYTSIAFAVATIVIFYFFITNYQRFIVSYGMSGLDRAGWMDPNYFGMAAGLGSISSAIELFRRKNNPILKAIYILATVSGLSIIVMVASRGALLSFICAIAIVIFSSTIKFKYKIIFVLLSSVVIVYMFTHSYFDLLLYRIAEDDNTGSNRTIIWANKINGYLSEGNILNWIFGYGGHYGAFDLGQRGSDSGVHNDYVAFLVEYGLVGIVGYLMMLWSPWSLIRKNSKKRVFVLSAISYIAICGLTLEPMAYGRFPFIAFYAYIIILANTLLNSQNEEETFVRS